MGGNLEQILRFCKLWFPLAMLVLLCVDQVVQIDNNESSSREKKEATTLYCKQSKDMQACQECKKS
jgi:hypothetical protein